MKIDTILDQIDLGAMALPEFQRGYVWNRDQVRGLMYSLYRKHPVGGLLVWVTKTGSASYRGDGALNPGTVELLLDGQQRITSLYGIIRGRAPEFFDGNPQAFTGLYFNLDEDDADKQPFEFYAPLKMKGNPFWIDVTELMQKGVGEFVSRLATDPAVTLKLTTYINRLTAVTNIRDIDLHIERVTGEDKTVDVVVDIFNRVNSGGTKLSKGDLALARICAMWPAARDQMKARLRKWEKAGFDFRLDWLLRNINAVLTGEAIFTALKDVDTPTFQAGLDRAEKSIDVVLNLIASRLGLDHDRVLGSRAAIPLMTRYFDQRGGKFLDHKERDKLLYWYVHTMLWGRYAGSTETVLNQDLESIEGPDGSLDRLLQHLRSNRGDLRLYPDDFVGWSLNARFYPLLYLLTRVSHSRDWCSGVELSNHLLGFMSSLELHHIFPKALLYQAGKFNRAEINALANFTFLTKSCNLQIGAKEPAVYLEQIAAQQPGALESHWIPMDRDLWKIENYLDFLAARRSLLAQAANIFLDSLVAGAVPDAPAAGSILDRDVVALPLGVTTEEEERVIQECNEWIQQLGLPTGAHPFELVEPSSGEVLAILDLVWPNGLQEGLSQPVALLINEDRETEEAAGQAGFRFFTDVESFRRYVQRDILATAEVVA